MRVSKDILRCDESDTICGLHYHYCALLLYLMFLCNEQNSKLLKFQCTGKEGVRIELLI